MEYIALLFKDSDSDFGVSFPDFPGCVAAGETLEEARAQAAEALQFHIEGMLENGEEIPAGSTLDEIYKHEDFSAEAVAFMVDVALPDKQVRFNLSAKESHLAAIDIAADRAGLNRSAFMVQAALERARQVTAIPVDDNSASGALCSVVGRQYSTGGLYIDEPQLVRSTRRRAPSLFERITGNVTGNVNRCINDLCEKHDDIDDRHKSLIGVLGALAYNQEEISNFIEDARAGLVLPVTLREGGEKTSTLAGKALKNGGKSTSKKKQRA
jgi:predicted RNase H-like HicB family nuclease